MRSKPEICVDTADQLLACDTPSVDRVELCAALAVGGLTPAPGLMALAYPSGTKMLA